MSFHFTAAVTIHSDFGAQENKVGHCFHSFPIYLTGSDELDAMNLVLSMLSFKPAFSLPSFSFIKRLFSYSSLSAIQFSSVAQSCPALCDPVDCTMPGLLLHHQPPEFAQTCVHQDGDAIHPSHPLSSASPSTFNLSQHQGLFQ